MAVRGEQISAAEARRIALAAQGFDRPRPSGRVDARAFQRVIDRMGLVQLDTVNVFARAHYMPFFSRLGAYDMAALDRFLWGRGGRFFEYMAHAASVVPVERYPLFRHRMAGGRRTDAWLMRIQDRPEVAAILDRVREGGPITIADVEAGKERLGGRWWTNEARLWLETLARTGQLAVRRERGFARSYDLPERVFAAEWLADPYPDAREAQRELVRLAVQHLGVGNVKDIADYYRLTVPDTRPLLRELVEAGTVREVRVEGWAGPVYLDPAARLPRRIEARALLSPFDPIMWERARASRLFGFTYQIEIYVPEPQRVYGYYVLPFLLNEALVARVDLRAERKSGTLVVLAAHIEDGADPAEVASALAEELRLAAEWQGLSSVRVEQRGGLARPLARAMRASG